MCQEQGAQRRLSVSSPSSWEIRPLLRFPIVFENSCSSSTQPGRPALRTRTTRPVPAIQTSCLTMGTFCLRKSWMS
ncbi:unnamed protein product, partial [Rangifer tarandus platyrhynchus]